MGARAQRGKVTWVTYGVIKKKRKETDSGALRGGPCDICPPVRSLTSSSGHMFTVLLLATAVVDALTAHFFTASFQ